MNIYRVLNKLKTKVPESDRNLEDHEMTDQMKAMAKKIAGKQNRRQTMLKKAAAVVIVAAVGGGTAVAAANGWENVMLKVFHQSLTDQKTGMDLEDYGGSDKVMAEDECNNMKVKVVQSAASKGMIYILLKVELPKNKTFKKDQIFKYHLLKTGAADDLKKKEITGMDIDRMLLVQTKDNVGWFIYQAERSDYHFKDRELKLSLEGFTSTHTTAKDLIFENPKGSWNLKWKVENSRLETAVASVDKEYQFQKEKVFIKKIEITPFYLRIYHGKKGSAEDSTNLPECSVRTKDGIVRNLSWSYSQGTDRSVNDYAYHHSDLTNLIDPDHVEAVMIGGSEIMISK